MRDVIHYKHFLVIEKCSIKYANMCIRKSFKYWCHLIISKQLLHCKKSNKYLQEKILSSDP